MAATPETQLDCFVRRDRIGVKARLAAGQSAPLVAARVSEAMSKIEALERAMGKTENESRAAAQAIADKVEPECQAVAGELDGVAKMA